MKPVRRGGKTQICHGIDNRMSCIRTYIVVGVSLTVWWRGCYTESDYWCFIGGNNNGGSNEIDNRTAKNKEKADEA